MGVIGSGAFGFGVMWLIWNVVASIDPFYANTPFAANWPASIGLIALGAVLDYLERHRK